MGSFGCCCGDSGSECCDEACGSVINRIEIELSDPGGGAPSIFTFPIGRSIRDNCYESMGFGDHCTQTVPIFAGGPCTYAIASRYDLKLTVTHTATSLPPRFEWACPLGSEQSGVIFLLGAKPKCQYSNTSNSHIYYWQDWADIDLSPSSSSFQVYVYGTFRGTNMSVSPRYDCDTDATVASNIQSHLISSLGGTYPLDFGAGTFSVAVERNHITCASPLGLFSQEARSFATCTYCTGEKVAILTIDGIFVQVVDGIIVVRFMQKIEYITTYTQIYYGGDCPSPTIFETVTSEKRVQINILGCFDPEYETDITFGPITAGPIFGCDFPTGYASTAVTTHAKIRVVYD